jgi:hypothetical protein
MPEKSGIDVVPWLGCCVNAGDENRTAAAVVAMMTVRMMVSHTPRAAYVTQSSRAIERGWSSWGVSYWPDSDDFGGAKSRSAKVGTAVVPLA